MDEVKHWSYTGTSDVHANISGQCQVVGCAMGQNKLKKWRTELCEIHQPYFHDSGSCNCRPPHLMYTFPKDPIRRAVWIDRLNNADYTFHRNHRICSRHFIGEEFTENNCYPTEFLGYASGEKLISSEKHTNKRGSEIRHVVVEKKLHLETLEKEKVNSEYGKFSLYCYFCLYLSYY